MLKVKNTGLQAYLTGGGEGPPGCGPPLLLPVEVEMHPQLPGGLDLQPAVVARVARHRTLLGRAVEHFKVHLKMCQVNTGVVGTKTAGGLELLTALLALK